MPEAGRIISNHTMYVFAKEKYLKELLHSGRITQEQFGRMERFLYERFQVASVDDFDIPIDSLIESQAVAYRAPEPVTAVAIAENIPALVESVPAQTAPKVSDDQNEYVSLTDLAREYNPDNPGSVIQLWLQNRNTIEFLKLWELRNNPQFNLSACEEIQSRLRDNAFTLTAKYWIEQTNGIGLQSKSGRYGGTFTHPIIACEFLTGLSPYLKFLLIEMASLRDTLAGQEGGAR